MVSLFFHGMSLAIVLLYALVFILSSRGARQVVPPAKPVNVILPTFNEAPVISACLESIRRLDLQGTGASVHVIDDASTDGTAEIVSTDFPEVNLIRRDARASKADALNSATDRLDGEVFAVVDADCIVDEGWLVNLVGELSDEEAGISTGSVLVSNRSDSTWTRLQSCELAFLCHQLMRPVERVGMLYSINGNNFAYRRNCWQRVRGFDPTKLTEDTDFAIRARLAGFQIRFAEAKVFTKVPARLKDLLRQRRRWYLGWYQDLSSKSLFAGAVFILLFYYAVVFFLLTMSAFAVFYVLAYFLELSATYKAAYGRFEPLNPIVFMILGPVLTTFTILTALPSALRGRDKLRFDSHW